MKLLHIFIGIILAPGALAGELTVFDPRPVAAAVLNLEQTFHVQINYEDIQYQLTDLIDVGTMDARFKGQDLLIPRPSRISILMPDDGQSGPEDGIRDVLSAWANQHPSKTFEFMRDSKALYVLPRREVRFDRISRKPLLDEKISITVDGPASAISVFSAICDKVQAVSGRKLILGTITSRAVYRSEVSHFAASSESARSVLARLISIVGRPISWQLLYDAQYEESALNLHDAFTLDSTSPTN